MFFSSQENGPSSDHLALQAEHQARVLSVVGIGNLRCADVEWGIFDTSSLQIDRLSVSFQALLERVQSMSAIEQDNSALNKRVAELSVIEAEHRATGWRAPHAFDVAHISIFVHCIDWSEVESLLSLSVRPSRVSPSAYVMCVRACTCEDGIWGIR